MSILVFVSSIALKMYMVYMNKKKRENQFSQQATEQREKSIEEIGDHHPGMCIFRLFTMR